MTSYESIIDPNDILASSHILWDKLSNDKDSIVSRLTKLLKNNQTKRNKTKRNLAKRNVAKRNVAKRNVAKRNVTKRNVTKRNESNSNRNIN